MIQPIFDHKISALGEMTPICGPDLDWYNKYTASRYNYNLYTCFVYEGYLPTWANQINGSESDILMVDEGNDDSVERPSMSQNYLYTSLSLVPLDAR